MTPAQQRDAIRKMMANRRRQLRDTSAGSYPKWKPGMTTKAYIQLYSIGAANVLPFGPVVYHKSHGQLYSIGAAVYHKSHGQVIDLSRFDRPAPWIEGPEVVEEPQEEDLAS